ncbi:MAG: Nucleoporin nup84 [Sclerophora amabilis]|nr:MAG: Nucleoporin nup84 [Sclerophora amabilis]
MAPITRKGRSFDVDGHLPAPFRNGRDDSWEVANSESRSNASRGDYSGAPDYNDGDHQAAIAASEMASALLGPAQYEQDLFPLKATADRVGREVEKFAEQLDKLSFLVRKKPDEKRKEVFMLVDEYHNLAKNAVGRLRRRHSNKRKAILSSDWRRKVKDFGRGPIENDSHSELDNFDDEINQDYVGPAPDTTVADLFYWEQEEQTWSLLRRLLDVRFPEHDTKGSEEGGINRFSSEERIWDHFLNTNNLAKERQTVLNWLTDTAEQSGDDINIIVEQLESGAPRGKGLWAHGWLYTKEAIKAQKRMRSWPQSIDPMAPGISVSLLNADKTESLVTQLDPDAVTRQERVMEKQDEYFERATWVACWEMLRRGRSWAEIREWCKDRVEGWRAMSLRGGIPAWDMAIDGEDVSASIAEFGDPSTLSRDDGLPMSQICGNRSRSLWRRMCFALARTGGMDEYERAIYGFLGGDLDSVQAVCTNWDDYVFAHYNSLLITQFDSYLRETYPDRFSESAIRKTGDFDSVQFHGQPDTAGRRLIDHLKTHGALTTNSAIPIKMMQGVLVANDFPNYIYQQGLMLAKLANMNQESKIIPTMEEQPADDFDLPLFGMDDHDSLRVMTHIFFVFKDLGLDIGVGHREVAIENVIVAYIDFLRLSGKLAMIPLYASRLSTARQTLTLGRVLLDTAAVSQRRELVKLMKSFHIDVPQVVETQLRFILDEVVLKEANEDISQLNVLAENKKPSRATMRPLKKTILDGDLTIACDKLIRSFEWYLLVDGYWAETFAAGALLYKKFFLSGHLTGARELLKRVPSSQISLTKSSAVLGKKVDITKHNADADEEEEAFFSVSRSTRQSRHQEARDWNHNPSSEHFKMLFEVLHDQAKVYMGFEELIVALCAFDDWAKAANQPAMHSGPSKAKSWRSKLQRAFDNVVAAMDPLMHGWLTDIPDEAASITAIRDRYLPELILAYVSVIQLAGHTLSRDILLQSMNLATVVAAEDSDVLPCFQNAGRLPELVTALATASKAILKASEEKGGGPRKSGGRVKGGTGEDLGIWNVRP